MNKFFLISIILLFTSCSNNKESLLVSPIDNGKITQRSSHQSNHARLHFKFDQNGIKYLGQQEIFSYEVKNNLSLPKHLLTDYFGLILIDKNNNTIYQTLKKNFVKFQSEFSSDYIISQYKTYFYIDVPININILDAKFLFIQNLKTNNVDYQTKITDISKQYTPIKKDSGWDGQSAVYKVLGDDTPSEHAFDIVVLAEGFSASEISLLSKDEMMNSIFGKQLTKYVLPAFKTEPFSLMTLPLKVWVVATASKDSGADIPSKGEWKRTVLDASFDAFCTRRSLTVKNQERALQLAAQTPFDQVIVMVNSDIYGGQGSDIATFSLNDRATFLIRHELGHAIGLLSDEYSFFSDTDSHNNCEDYQVVQYANHIQKNWGRNTLFESDQLLAPNLTLSSNYTSAKWSEHLTFNSPVVFFDYPTNYNNIIFKDDKSITISTTYTLQHNLKDLLLLFGKNTETNHYTNFVESIVINGVNVDFKFINTQHLTFIKTIGTQFNNRDQLKVKVTLSSKTPFNTQRTDYYKSDLFFLTIPNTTFSGGTEIGLFQGAFPSMSLVFRSSYNSIMNGGAEFDTVQNLAYLKLINYFK